MRDRLVSLALLCLLSAAMGCASREAVGTRAITVLGAGVVNNPGNKSLRFDLLKFGLETFCEEMLRGNAPIKMSDEEPTSGRFFADTCQAQVIDDETHKSFIVQYTGRGYAWTNVTGRMGFATRGLVEYAADFQVSGGALYVYFRPKLLDATAFQTLMVESIAARAGISLSGVNPDELGRKIVEAQLQRGFTVIRYNTLGETGFSMGLIARGQRPFQPFVVERSDKLTVVNERLEIHSGQQDYIGALRVEEGSRSLFLTLLVEGAPSVEVKLVGKSNAQSMLDRYIRSYGAAPLSAPAWFQATVPSGTRWSQEIKVPPGDYYLVFDHPRVAGPGSHPNLATGQQAVRVDTLVLREP